MVEVKTPLMPMSVAAWLVTNSRLTFNQIAKFCNLHPAQIQSIADSEDDNLTECNPIAIGQITEEELKLCEQDEKRVPKVRDDISKLFLKSNKRKHKSYVPVARRRDKPDAVYWMILNCPYMSDDKIAKLIGTTKNTVNAIRTKEHWNSNNIKPRDPVLLGLCKQSTLDEATIKAQIADEKQRRIKNIQDAEQKK